MRNNYVCKSKVFLLCTILMICIFLCTLCFGCTDSNDAVSTISDGIGIGSNTFHLSFDDTMKCLINLSTADNNYKSVFDEPFLGYLYSLNQKYGLKVSIYTYNDIIKNVPDTYKKELGEASSWLKFGLHSTSHKERFTQATYDDGKNAWNEFVSNVIRITGSVTSIDRMPRLHYWEGTEDALQGMRDASYGAIGFLTAEHDYPSYYLSKEQHTYVYNHDHLTDYNNSLVFVSTDLCLDWFTADYKTSNIYHKPTKNSVYEELEYRFSSPEFADTLQSYQVFGHEIKYYNGKTISNEGKAWLDEVGKYAYEHKIPFSFPQDRSYNPTIGDIK